MPRRKPAEAPAGRIPAYVRIKKAISDRIVSGEVKSGDRVESERDLARRYGVSLMTARHALQDLEAEGMVTRHVGVGTFVAPPQVHFNKLLGFTELMILRGLRPQSKVLSVQMAVDNEEVAARLRQPAGAALLRVERLRLGDAQPFALETVYLPSSRFPGMTRRQLERGSLFHVFQQDYGLALAHADEEVDATAADARTARHLGVAQGAPVLRIRQLLYATTGEPVLYEIGLYRSERHSLSIRRYR